MKLKRREVLAGMLLAAASLGGLCACQNTTSPSGTADTEELPELRIGVDILRPFYFIDEGGNPTGLDAEIAQEACQRAGYTPVFVDIPWDEKDDYLKSGTVDCLWNAFAADGREDKYSWTISYMESRLRIIVDAGTPDQTPKDLERSGGIALRAGSKVEEIILGSGEPTTRIYACGTFEMARTAFIKGYASALAANEAVLQQMLDEYPGIYRFLDGELMTVHFGVAFARYNPAQAYQPLNRALAEMKQDGSLTAIVQKYTAADSDAEEGGTHV